MNTGHRSLLFLGVLAGVIIPWMMYVISEPFKYTPKMENLTRPTQPTPSPLKYPPVAGAKPPSTGLQVNCDSCGAPFGDEFGGLLFSPPNGKTVEKYHICRHCYNTKFQPLIK